MHLQIHRTQVPERFVEIARIALSGLTFYALVLTLCRLLPYGRSLTSRSIGEALPNDAFDRALGALYVVYANTTLSVPALTGVIMSMGVATANSIIVAMQVH